MIGHPFPADAIEAVLPDGDIAREFSIPDYARGSAAAIFFYPLDFSGVCTSEVAMFRDAIGEFERRQAKVVGVSIDSSHAHRFWRNAPRDQGGVGELPFPLASDLNRRLASQLGILNDDGVTYRATFILDREGVVRQMSMNEILIARSLHDVLGALDALALHEKTKEPVLAAQRQALS